MAAETNKQEDISYIAISADEYPAFRVDTTVLFFEELAARGHRFSWYMRSAEECNSMYSVDHGHNKIFVGRTDIGSSRLSRVRKHVRGLLDQLKFLHSFKQAPIKFILIKNQYLIALPALLLAKFKKIPYAFWLSYPHAEEGLFKVKQGTARYPVFYWLRAHAFAFLLYKVVMRFADKVFVQSAQMKRDIAAKGVDPEKLVPVPMGVSLREFEAYLNDPLASSESNDHLDIVYVGTLQSARKMDFLVRAFSLVHEQDPNTRLILVGDGNADSDREMLEQEIHRLGLENVVEITGFVDRGRAMRFVADAGVCVSPFYPDPILNSTSPTKLVEYWAMGKAVVANDHPEQSLTIEESAGGLCVPYAEEAFAQAMLQILHDPEGAARMGANGRRYVENHRAYSKIATLVDQELRQLVQINLV